MDLKIELAKRRLYNVNDPDMWYVRVSDTVFPEYFAVFTARSQAQGIEDALKWGGIDGIEIEVK